MKKLLFLFLPFFIMACEKNEPEMATLGENTGIVGIWVENRDESPGEDGATLLVRSDDFEEDLYGFWFSEDGYFRERKNAGWCGTPPIYYDNFDGSWTPLNDTLIDITVAYWGGIMTYQMWIVSLEGDRMSVRYLFTEDHVDVK